MTEGPGPDLLWSGFGLTVKLLLTFLVLDSATLASVRSTSSKMMDCRQTGSHSGSIRKHFPTSSDQ